MTERDRTAVQRSKWLVDRMLDGQSIDLALLDGEEAADPDVQALYAAVSCMARQYGESSAFMLNLSKGILDTEAPLKNNFISPFKQLQSVLLHLTWQIQQISEGDLEQQVLFSGDFSDSINRMIEALREKQRISELNEQYLSELKALNATKDKFFSIIAHDLKNPFFGLVSLSELLLESIRSGETANMEEYAVMLVNSSKQGYKLLMNLLDWSRVQTNTLQVRFTDFELSDVIWEVLEGAGPVARTKGIDLTTDCPKHLTVCADYNVVHTVLRNLVGNAKKFTHPNGTVRVQVQTVEGEVLVAVVDNGVGISAEALAKLFRIDTCFSTPGTSKERGTGLGLILCKELLTKMGSDIEVESVQGVGSTFRFRLKLAQL